MPGKFTSVRITGQAEVIAGFNKVEEFDKVEAARMSGDALLPFIRAGSRVFTGAMVGSFMMEGEYIVNEQEYAVIQEYGSIFVEPTNAIARAAEMHDDILLSGYEDRIDDAIDDAGFSSF